MKAQALEITELKRRSVTPSSEASDTSFNTTPKQQQPSSSQSKPNTSKEVSIPGDEVSCSYYPEYIVTILPVYVSLGKYSSVWSSSGSTEVAVS